MFFQAPWRIPGNYEIPDIIKEAWEKNKDKIMNSNNNIPQQKKQQLDNKSKINNNNQPQKVLHSIRFINCFSSLFIIIRGGYQLENH